MAVRNEAWAVVSERIRRFEEGRLPLSQLVAELVALRPSMDPPRKDWADTFDAALGFLRELVETAREREWPEWEPGMVVNDHIQTLARLVRHPDDA